MEKMVYVKDDRGSIMKTYGKDQKTLLQRSISEETEMEHGKPWNN